MAQAKQEFRDWDAEITGLIDRLRAKAGRTGIVLTHREDHGLAGAWYAWFIARHEDEPGTTEGRDLLVEALESAYKRDDDDVPDNLTPADVYFGKADTILAERQRTKRNAPDQTLAAPPAGRLNSNPDEPDPPFENRLNCLKLSADGQPKK